MKSGARGLRSVLENSLLDIMYNLPTIKKKIHKIIINTSVIKNYIKPILIYKD